MDLPFESRYFVWAVGLGALSAVSLPLGSAIGLVARPRARLLAALTAFGGGALLAALSVELVAPKAHEVAAAMGSAAGSHGGASPASPAGAPGAHGAPAAEAIRELLGLLAGTIIGGILFVVLDQIVNARGGFLRKTAYTITFLGRARRKRQEEILRRASRLPLVQRLPGEQVPALVDAIRPARFVDGEKIFDEGDPGDRMYFIESGRVRLTHDGAPLKELGEGDIIGEIALLTGRSRTATARALGTVQALVLLKNDFDRLRAMCPELEAEAASVATERLEELASRREERAKAEKEWSQQAAEALRTRTIVPSADEIRRAKEEHGGAPLAIWLGILLDGIPESFVIGAGLLALIAARTGAAAGGVGEAAISFADVIPYTLIAGLFLSNFPEALSSSVGMRQQGWAWWKIFFMWLTLMVVTALGAGLGYAAGGSAPGLAVVFVEGLAAGAMLTMIASAMIPEAVHIGSPTITGLGTLSGFVSAVAFKILG